MESPHAVGLGVSWIYPRTNSSNFVLPIEAMARALSIAVLCIAASLLSWSPRAQLQLKSCFQLQLEVDVFFEGAFMSFPRDSQVIVG